MTGGPDRTEGSTPSERAEVVKPRRIERFLPGEFDVIVGNPINALNRARPDIGDVATGALIDGVNKGAINKLRVTVGNTATNAFKEINVEGAEGPKEVDVFMAGDWREEELVPAGHPLMVSEKDKKLQLYRRINPSATRPLVEVGDVLEANDPLLIGMKGKKNRKPLRLPKKQFPQGGKVTAIFVPDTKDGLNLSGGEIFAYVDPK